MSKYLSFVPLSMYNIAAFLRSQLFLLPVLLFFYQENGLSVGDFYLIQGLIVFFAFLFEIPAGYLGDIFPRKNVLMKALGAAETIEMDIFDVERGVEGIFLCSDGLTNMLTDEQIEKVLNDEELMIEEKINKLIMKSNSRGGTDNITIAYMDKRID